MNSAPTFRSTTKRWWATCVSCTWRQLIRVALAVVAQEVGRQAEMGAMLDVFKVIAYSYVFMAPLVFLLKRSTTQRAGPPPAAE